MPHSPCPCLKYHTWPPGAEPSWNNHWLPPDLYNLLYLCWVFKERSCRSSHDIGTWGRDSDHVLVDRRTEYNLKAKSSQARDWARRCLLIGSVVRRRVLVSGGDIKKHTGTAKNSPPATFDTASLTAYQRRVSPSETNQYSDLTNHSFIISMKQSVHGTRWMENFIVLPFWNLLPDILKPGQINVKTL